MKAADFFALPPSLAPFSAHFVGDVAPWEWLRRIGTALAALPEPLPRSDVPPGVHLEGRVWLHPTVKLPPQATILGPTWIGAGSEIRPGAFIRGNVIAGERCVLGHASEFKQCVLLDGAQAPHFNYVGDSILGYGAHLGAGAICSNLRLDQAPVVVRGPAGELATGLVKLGAILGDRAEVGCNAVLNPGSVLGRRALVMPAMAFSGYLPEATIAHVSRPVRLLPRRD